MRSDDSAGSGSKLPVWDQKTACVIGTVLIFAAVGAFCYAAWKVLVAFLFAIFLAYLFDPVVSLAQRRSPLSAGSRARAIAQVYVGVGIILAVLILVAGPKLQSEARKLSTAAPVWMDQLTSGRIAWQIGSKRGWSAATQERVQGWLESHREYIMDLAGRLGSYTAALVVNSVWLILVPILSIFFLRDGRSFADSLIDVLDRRRQRQFLSNLLDDLDTMLARYIRAQLILAGLTLVAFTSVLTLMRLPYSVVLGVIGGVLEFIPVVGPLVAAGLIVAVAIFSSYSHVLLILVFLGVWRILQDYVTSPRIMGSSVELHPLAALFAILAGAEVAGVIGVYLSIPIAATLRIFWNRWRTYNTLALQPELPAAKRKIG